jgi:hypothetical protein
MASIDTMTFDQAAYSPGDTVTLSVGYTPDTPAVTPQVFTATATISDAAGNVLGSNTAPFTVNVPQPGDKVGVSDDGNHTWAEASDSGTVAVFTTTA